MYPLGGREAYEDVEFGLDGLEEFIVFEHVVAADEFDVLWKPVRGLPLALPFALPSSLSLARRGGGAPEACWINRTVHGRKTLGKITLLRTISGLRIGKTRDVRHVLPRRLDQRLVNVYAHDRLGAEEAGDSAGHVALVAPDVENLLPAEPIGLEVLESHVLLVVRIPVAVVAAVVPELEPPVPLRVHLGPRRRRRFLGLFRRLLLFLLLLRLLAIVLPLLVAALLLPPPLLSVLVMVVVLPDRLLLPRLGYHGTDDLRTGLLLHLLRRGGPPQVASRRPFQRQRRSGLALRLSGGRRRDEFGRLRNFGCSHRIVTRGRFLADAPLLRSKLGFGLRAGLGGDGGPGCRRGRRGCRVLVRRGTYSLPVPEFLPPDDGVVGGERGGVLVLVDAGVEVEGVGDVGRDEHLDLVLCLPVLWGGERRGLWRDGVDYLGDALVSEAVQIQGISDVASEQELGGQDRLVHNAAG